MDMQEFKEKLREALLDPEILQLIRERIRKIQSRQEVIEQWQQQ